MSVYDAVIALSALVIAVVGVWTLAAVYGPTRPLALAVARPVLYGLAVAGVLLALGSVLLAARPPRRRDAPSVAPPIDPEIEAERGRIEGVAEAERAEAQRAAEAQDMPALLALEQRLRRALGYSEDSP